jgi:hypothetical protein
MYGKARPFLSVLLLAVVLPATCKPGTAQTTLYDNFDNTLINPNNWFGLEQYDPDMRESKREITPTPRVTGDRRLHLLQRGYSATTDNVGATGGALGLLFTAPNNVTATSFTVVVAKEQVVGCAANSTVGAVSAGFEGAFFNPSSAPIGATGDVKANIVIVRTTTNTGKSLNAGASYYQCNDSTCSTSTPLFSQGLGTVLPGSTNTLTLTWDQANHQFIFQLNGNAPVTSTYTVGDGFPPGYAAKYLTVERLVPHCASTPRPSALVEAYFDNVYVNP